MPKAKKTTQDKMFKRVMNLLVGSRYKFIESNEVLAELKHIMKLSTADKKPFRGTQTRFDKVFYNLITNRDKKFVVDGVTLVNFTRPTDSGPFLMSITNAGRDFVDSKL